MAKILWYNLAVLLFCFGALEIGAAVFYAKHDRIRLGGGLNYVTSDEFLGYAPKKNIKLRSRKYHDNKLIYDVTYTINDKGLRISPPFERPGCRDTVLFFGCSFTFGEGLNDDETMPFLVGALSQAKVYNFGFQGYGPHQMLSAIEHGLVEKAVDCKPKYAIYQTAFFHVERAAGYLPGYLLWSQHTPKYILSQDGKVKYAGHFDDAPMKKIIDNLLQRSSIYQNFVIERSHVNKKDVERYIAIVIAAYKELLKKFPGLEFHVIYWNGAADDMMIVERFQKEGIKIHLITDILPEWDKRQSDYIISDFDRHPNLTANKYIANYIIQNILQKSEK